MDLSENSGDSVIFQANDVEECPILRLNDDCLLQIFSSKLLTIIDLCSLAETCTRFQQIIRPIFRMRFCISVNSNSNYEISTKNHLMIWNRSYGEHGAKDIERIFKNFGLCLVGISISTIRCDVHGEPFNVLMNLVTKYCVDSLRRLRLYGMKIRGTLPFNSNFKQLAELELTNVSMRRAGVELLSKRQNAVLIRKSMFADFDSLTVLKLINVENYNAVLKFFFPKLVQFHFHSMDRESYHSLVAFVSNHATLKALDLHIDGTSMAKIRNLIVGCSERVQELTITSCKNMKASSLLLLKPLKQLEILKLRSAKSEDLQFISSLANLRELFIFFEDSILLRDSNQFATFTQLTKLCVHGAKISGPIDVVGIIRRLTNLQELIVEATIFVEKGWTNFELSEKEFYEILEIVSGRMTVLTLKCKVNFENCMRNGKVKLIPL